MSQRLEVAESLRDQAANRLREEILSGRIAMGARLSISALADDYGVSLMPIREALRELEAEGLVEAEARRWTRVVEPKLRTVKEVYPLIIALEVFAVTTAVEPDLEALARHTQALQQAVGRADAAASVRADEDFHTAIVRATANETLLATLSILRARVRVLERAFFGLAEREQSSREHREIIDALAANDRSRAAIVLERHWLRGQSALVDWFNREAPR